MLGSTNYVYQAEVLASSAMGFVNFIQMIFLCVISTISPSLIDSDFGIVNLFLVMGGLQVIPCVFLGIFMKETKGLNGE